MSDEEHVYVVLLGESDDRHVDSVWTTKKSAVQRFQAFESLEQGVPAAVLKWPFDTPDPNAGGAGGWYTHVEFVC